jgi:hypothetical protein
MRKALILIFLAICSTNVYSIVDGIRITHNRKNTTFQKEDIVLTINLNHIMTGNDNVLYQHINSYNKNGYYFFLFFAKSWWKSVPTAWGEWGAGEIHTVFIIKIKNDFSEYEIINQYLDQLIPQEYMMTADMFKKNGTVFHWFIMGFYRGDNHGELFKIVSIDAAKLENGFIVNEYQTIELIGKSWNNLEGDFINYNNEEYIFNWKLDLVGE